MINITRETLEKNITGIGNIQGYNRSYNLVLVKIVFEFFINNKKAYDYQVARKFKQFYMNKKLACQQIDKNIDYCMINSEHIDLGSVLITIKNKPYKYLNEKGIIYIGKDEIGEYFFLSKDFNLEDIKYLLKLIEKNLETYFDKIKADSKPLNIYENTVQTYEERYQRSRILLKSINENYKKRFLKLEDFDLIETILDNKESHKKLGEWIKEIWLYKNQYVKMLPYKEAISIFLVGCAKYHYNDNDGGFWKAIKDDLHIESATNKRILIDIFNQTIESYKLETFSNVKDESYTWIAPIICHAGIPSNCLFDYFDVLSLLLDSGNINYSLLEEEVFFACRYASKAVKRNLKFLAKKGVLADSVIKNMDVINEVMTKGDFEVDNYDLSEGYRESIMAWTKTKKDKGGFSSRVDYISSPELFCDVDYAQISIKLPALKGQKNQSLMWKIQDGNDVLRKKMYGKKNGEFYFYDDTEIYLNNATAIKVDLLNDVGNSIYNYIVKKQEEIIIFNINGNINKSKFLNSKGAYFICENNCSVGNGFNYISNNYDSISLYYFDSEHYDKALLNDGKELKEFNIKLEIELTNGIKLFNHYANFERYDVYSELPDIIFPQIDEWEFTISFNNEAKNRLNINGIDKISIHNLLIKQYDSVKYGIYSFRIYNKKYGYKSFKLAYLPQCTMERKNWFPNKDGYIEQELIFSEKNGLTIYNENLCKIEDSITIHSNIETYRGCIEYDNIKYFFNIILKPISWSIYDENKVFGENNKKIRLSTKDLYKTEWTLLRIKNYLNEKFTLVVENDDNIIKEFKINPYRNTIINLKEINDIFSCAKNGISNIRVLRDKFCIADICKIKIETYIKNFSCKQDENGYLFKWEEDGPCIGRKLILYDIIKPYNKTEYPIEDSCLYYNINNGLLDDEITYVAEIKVDVNNFDSIYNDYIDEKEELRNSESAIIINRTKATLPVFNCSYSQLINTYIFHHSNIAKRYFNSIYDVTLNEERSAITKFRYSYGDVPIYNNIFKYNISDDLLNEIMEELSLWIPKFIANDRLSNSATSRLKENNIYIYFMYCFAKKDIDKLTSIYIEFSNFVDNESWCIAKEDLLIPHFRDMENFYNLYNTFYRTSEKKSEILIKTLCEYALNQVKDKEINEEINKLSNSISNIYKNYQLTFMNKIFNVTLRRF